MTGFVVELDAEAAVAAEEAAASTGGGDFPPLPRGKYQATIIEVLGTADFGGSGPNKNKKVVRIKVQIVEDSPTGRRRTFYDRIPLFSRYAPNEKNPKGAVARTFWDFFEKSIGWPREQILAGNMPGPADLLGKQVTITLGAPIEPDQYNPLGSNEIDFWDAAGDIAATPQTPVRVPWLDDHGNLNPNWVSNKPQKQQGGGYAQPPQQTAPPTWNGGQQQAPAAQPPAYNPPPQAAQATQYAPPAYAPPAAQAAPQAGPPAWQPNPADVAYAQQQAPQDPLQAAAQSGAPAY